MTYWCFFECPSTKQRENWNSVFSNCFPYLKLSQTGILLKYLKDTLDQLLQQQVDETNQHICALQKFKGISDYYRCYFVIVMCATCGSGNTHSFWNIFPLPLESSWFHPFIAYIVSYLSVLGTYLRIHDWLVCLPGLIWLLCLEIWYPISLSCRLQYWILSIPLDWIISTHHFKGTTNNELLERTTKFVCMSFEWLIWITNFNHRHPNN